MEILQSKLVIEGAGMQFGVIRFVFMFTQYSMSRVC